MFIISDPIGKIPYRHHSEDLANFNRDLETVRSFIKGPILTCNNCRHLCVINNKEIYACCHKTGYIFEPFGTDTRSHYCSFADSKCIDGKKRITK